MAIDFSRISSELLSGVRTFIHEWLPGGKLVGKEYCCSNLRGGNGDSLKVNIESGEWCDFADPSSRGGDLVSLWAAINHISQGDAARALRPDLFTDDAITNPPVDAAGPSFPGNPTCSWCYRDREGNPLFHVVRYDMDGKKTIVPYSWSSSKGRWIKKGYPEPRPLYGLDLLEARPKHPVMVVEGEKSCEAARALLGDLYVVVTWSNGSSAVSKTDWSPLKGRNIVIWPDADQPGARASLDIARLCAPTAISLKIIHPEGKDGGWDAADAVSEGMDTASIIEWAKPRVKPYAELQSQQSLPVTPVQATVDAGSVDVVKRGTYALWDSIGIVKSSNGQPIVNIDNCIRVFQTSEEYTNRFWYDTFHQKIFTDYDGKAHELADVDWLRVSARFQREKSLNRFNDETIRKAITIYAHERQISEPKEWMESLKWDGNCRIDGFFALCMGCEDTNYSRAVSSNWWISMVARIFSPGCKVDNMVILEGCQGNFKTTAFDIIGGAWYAESHESVISKDFYQILQGKLIIEIAEMDTFTKAEATTVKKIVTCRVDRYRESYGRLASDHPRQCVFVGTTNEDHYLRDTTGARRFWPIKAGRINLALIRQEREQLYAEAVHRYKNGQSWWEMPEETVAVQESRRQHDEWESVVWDYIKDHQHGVTLREVAEKAICMETSRIDVMAQRRLSKIMKLFRWSFDVVPQEGSNATYRVWKPAKTEQIE